MIHDRKHFIKYNSKLRLLYHFFKKIDDSELSNLLLDKKNPSNLQFQHFGNENPDKNIYILKNHDPQAGFFAVFRFMLAGLYFSDKFNMTPVIDYSHSLYTEDHPILGTSNAFEYYFIQPSTVNLDEAYRSQNVVVSTPVDYQFAEQLNFNGENGYEVSDKYLTQMAKLVDKHIKLNHSVGLSLEQDIAHLGINSSVLGVHFRGTDYKNNYDRHPVSLIPESYFVIIDEALQTNKFESIFLATDDSQALAMFLDRYGSSIKYYTDSQRSNGNTSVAFLDIQRENHKYLCGYEVLRDVITLSKCGGLIAGMSHIGVCARIFKQSRNEIYAFSKILNRGINKSKRKFKK